MAALNPFLAVIWHDLGTLGLLDSTVEVFFEMQVTQEMPMYFMGERLASSQTILSNAARERWASLTKLTAADARTLNNQVNFKPGEDAVRNQIEGYWALVDGFGLNLDVDVTSIEEGAEILATSDNEAIPLVLRYPSRREGPVDVPRRFMQNFPLLLFGDETAVFARKVLFENALCYLVTGFECECPDAVMTMDIAQLSREALEVAQGESFLIDFDLSNNGRCLVRGGQLTLTLPKGLELDEVASSKGIASRWDDAARALHLAVGIVKPSEENVLVKLRVIAESPGARNIVIKNSGNNFDERVTDFPVSVDGLIVKLQRGALGDLELIVSGMPGAKVELQWASELGAIGSVGRWTDLVGGKGGLDSEGEFRVTLPNEGGVRFYRAVGR